MTHWSQFFLKPLDVRLKIAYMADALATTQDQPLTECEAGNGLGRTMSGSSHPYTQNWHRVVEFYALMRWDDLCDAEILEQFQKAVSIGFKTPTGIKVPAETVHKAVKRWRNNGWYRYEHQRDGRRKLVKPAVLIGLALFGLPALDV